MKEFLIENYSWIITIACSVASLLIFIFKKVKVIKKDTAFEKVLGLLPSLIVKAEKSQKTGSQKKDFVLWSAMNFLTSLLDHQMSVDEVEIYRDKIDEAIEEILMTPKKKEVADESKK